MILGFLLFLGSLMQDLAPGNTPAESDFEISNWSGLHSTVWRRVLLQPSNKCGFHSLLIFKWSFLDLLPSGTGISVLRYLSCPLGRGRVTSRWKLAVQCAHPIQKLYVDHSPVGQTTHPVDLLRVVSVWYLRTCLPGWVQLVYTSPCPRSCLAGCKPCLLQKPCSHIRWPLSLCSQPARCRSAPA